ncbi:unnamed protein product [Rhodiola kirilowii]
MSEIHALNPNKNYEGWETVDDDDSQEFEPAANIQQPKGTSDHKVHIEEHTQYDIVIESPGVKNEPQKTAYEIVVDNAHDETVENYNMETTKEFTGGLVLEKVEMEKMT